MFKKQKIKGKLVTGFGIVTALALIVGLIGVVGLYELDKQMLAMYEGPTQGIYYSSQMEGSINLMQAEYLSMLRNLDNPDELQVLNQAIEDIEDTFDGYYESYKLTMTGDSTEDAGYFEALRAAYYDVLIALGDQLQAAALNGDGDTAVALYDEMNTHADQIISAAQNLVSFNTQLCISMNEQSTQVKNFMSTLLIIVLIVALFLSGFLGLKISGMIANPTKKLVEAADAIAVGDVEVRLDIDSTDEIGELAGAFGNMVEAFREQAQVLQRIADGDYTADLAVRSDRDVVNRSIVEIIEKNNQVMSEIRSASDQVASGSQQIAQGAQSLASGSSEQAATLEEFSAAITEVLAQSQENTRQAMEAFEDTQKVGSLMAQSMDSMGRMTIAMQEINESSRNISRVIKVIDDIAFQTNILALNAAVEAARAGQHGKGFAVVADEVRNLASKSASAAKETASLIENSTQKVTEGNEIAAFTGESLQAVSEISSSTAQAMSKINESSQRQSNSIAEITQGINQISSVVQENSATAEESAASAEQMASQSSLLSGIVARFRLKNQPQGDSPRSAYADQNPEAFYAPAEQAFALSMDGKY